MIRSGRYDLVEGAFRPGDPKTCTVTVPSSVTEAPTNVASNPSRLPS